MNKKIPEVRGVKFGTGIPVICVPVVAGNDTELITVLDKMAGTEKTWDMIEYRADYHEDLKTVPAGSAGEKFRYCRKALSRILPEIRGRAGNIPVLFTVRTAREGGEFSGDFSDYCALNLAAAGSGLVDMIDTELFAAVSSDELFRQYSEEKELRSSFLTSEEGMKIRALIEKLHRMGETAAASSACRGICVIGSSHDFEHTPPEDVIISRLRTMQEVGCDITKIAVMPHGRQDVFSLMEASARMYEEYADRPLITMSMGKNGRFSRIAGELTGSCLSFATVGRASAPGQMGAGELRKIFRALEE